MSGGGFYRGTSQDQDARFSNKDKKLLNSMKWPEEFSKKVDLKKVRNEKLSVLYYFDYILTRAPKC